LFQFSDAFRDGPARYKVDAAVDTMRSIFPGVEARGVNMSIPMPGHSDSSTVSNIPSSILVILFFRTNLQEAETRANVQQLLDLIHEHDVVFLLTDTRERYGGYQLSEDVGVS
jgi:ubiquitin-like modifier-activating enzyme ATG7